MMTDPTAACAHGTDDGHCLFDERKWSGAVNPKRCAGCPSTALVLEEALREFLGWADNPRPADCPYCFEPQSWELTTEHRPECPFVKARAALASTTQEPAPAADAEGVADLTERCKEIIDWQDTGTLKGEALRNFAKRQQEIGIPEYHALPVAESKTAREAMEFVIAAAAQAYFRNTSPHPRPLPPPERQRMSDVKREWPFMFRAPKRLATTGKCLVPTHISWRRASQLVARGLATLNFHHNRWQGEVALTATGRAALSPSESDNRTKVAG